MNCPVCRQNLREVSFENLSVYACRGCGGIWLDRGQLRKVIDGLLAKEMVEDQTVEEAFGTKALGVDRAEQAARTCPRCRIVMRVQNYSYDSNVFIDKCPDCGGIWTDRDELQAIARYVKGHPVMERFAGAVSEAEGKLQKLAAHAKGTREVSRGLTSAAGLSNYLFVRYSLFPIPLKDDLSTRRVPVVTYSLIAVNILIFLGQVVFHLQDDRSFYDLIGVIPSLGFASDRLYTFVTSMFVHIGFFHILANMYFLWIFGDNVEDEIGSGRFLLFYLLCGIGGAVAMCLAHPDLAVPGVGASGAISGVLAAYLVRFPRSSLTAMWLGRIRQIRALWYLLAWIVLQLIWGIGSLGCRSVGVGYWAHIGGFAAGLVLIFLFSPGKQTARSG